MWIDSGNRLGWQRVAGARLSRTRRNGGIRLLEQISPSQPWHSEFGHPFQH